MTTLRSTNALFFSSPFVHSTAGHHFPRRRLPAFRELVSKRASGPPACHTLRSRGRASAHGSGRPAALLRGSGAPGQDASWRRRSPHRMGHQYTHHCGAYVGEPLCSRPSSRTKNAAAHPPPPPSARRTPVAQELRRKQARPGSGPPANDESHAEQERSSDGRHFAWLSCRPIWLLSSRYKTRLSTWLTRRRPRPLLLRGCRRVP